VQLIRRRSFPPFFLGVFLAAFLAAWPGSVNPASSGEAPSPPELASKLEPLLNSPPLSEAQVGLSIVQISNGEAIFNHNADQSFIPASNQKLLLSATALARLGADFRFRTPLLADSAPEGSGVLHGNLYLQGHGDPTLTCSALAAFVQTLKKDGVCCIAGDLVGDDSYFSGSPFGSGWLEEDLDKSYAAPASAICLEENLLKVTVLPGGQVGGKALCEVDPASPLVSIANNCLTVKKGGRCWTSLSRINGNSFRLTGRIAVGHSPIVHVMPVRSPSLLAVSVLPEMLKAAGIKLKGPARLGVVPKDALLLDTAYSPTLSQILKAMNKESNNHYAEQILRTLGAEVSGVGDDLAGTQAISDYLKTLLAVSNLPVICDGSGLSPKNSLSPSLLTALLAKLPHLPYWEPFRDSLPIAGVDGTLKRRLKGTPAQGKIYAKTGTLKGVSSISGYVMGNDRPLLAFSLLVNDIHAPLASVIQAEDSICSALWEYAATP
jgi:PBP4 family serine-type D-alanyl-D-alanine carboxypeptidase